MKHYSVDNKTKTVIANITRLTEKEIAEVQRYVSFGYTVEDGVPAKKVSVKRLTEEYILNYLEGDDEAIKKYYDVIHSKCVVKDANGREVVKTRETKKGVKQVEQGFNAGKFWFAKTYPKNIAELKLTADQKAEIKKAFKAYNEKPIEDGKSHLSEDEYTKSYYWTKIFNQN